jgi:hypothetical protein
VAGRGRVVLEGIRFAAGVVSDPSVFITLWKTATGGKAIGCLPASPIPELLYAAILLPIALETTEDPFLISGRIDAWLVGAASPPFHVPPAATPRFEFSAVPPCGVEEALDRVEAVAEWVGAVSGSLPSEGALWKSIRTYAIRRSLLDELDERCLRDAAFLTPEEYRDIVRAGIFLPPEAHSRLLSSLLGIDPEHAVLPAEEEKGDPLIVLAKRLM